MYPAADAEKKGGGDAMEPEQAKAIAKFIAEVKKYICGDRAQGKLALEDPPEPAKTKGADVLPLPGMDEPPAN